MEKTEAVNKLKKAGYQVQFDSSIVTVLLEKRANITQEIKKLKAYLQEIGYDASFGIKQIKDDSCSERKDSISQNEESVQESVKDSFEQGETFKQIKMIDQEESSEYSLDFEEIPEFGKQFSLEDFGIS